MMIFLRRVSANELKIACAGAAFLIQLGGCALVNDDATAAFVSPGKFDYYSCDQLMVAGRALSAQERELSELSARAARGGATGEFVGTLAYRTELLQARGQLKQIANLSVQKNCSAQSKWQSDRALW